jgi:hypothetical protein
MAASGAGLFIGTTNHARGTSIYRSRARPCAGATTRAVPPARPTYALPPRVRRALEHGRVSGEFSSPFVWDTPGRRRDVQAATWRQDQQHTGRMRP